MGIITHIAFNVKYLASVRKVVLWYINASFMHLFYTMRFKLTACPIKMYVNTKYSKLYFPWLEI